MGIYLSEPSHTRESWCQCQNQLFRHLQGGVWNCPFPNSMLIPTHKSESLQSPHSSQTEAASQYIVKVLWLVKLSAKLIPKEQSNFKKHIMKQLAQNSGEQKVGTLGGLCWEESSHRGFVPCAVQWGSHRKAIWMRHVYRMEVDKGFWESTQRKFYLPNKLRPREERAIKDIIGVVHRILS